MSEIRQSLRKVLCLRSRQLHLHFSIPLLFSPLPPLGPIVAEPLARFFNSKTKPPERAWLGRYATRLQLGERFQGSPTDPVTAPGRPEVELCHSPAIDLSFHPHIRAEGKRDVGATEPQHRAANFLFGRRRPVEHDLNRCVDCACHFTQTFVLH